MEKNLKQISKFMSLVLRHKPETIDLHLDEQGWAAVDELIEKMNATGAAVDKEMIRQIVDTNDKKRFAFNEDQSRIRASQGHSIDVDLSLEPVTPPDILYHGTAARFVESILQDGLLKQNRQHVHLTALKETAIAVGGRHGKPVVLEVNAGEMAKAGFEFYLSANNVWLVEIVLPEYISIPGQ
ncbi:RNA 2'-phosphotransferase [Pseudoflavitalea rhizosphaerae]|uniref:RNA 2'-phosphotransferase n=1 Tax=Pseudoflavitalea rhizosphaerae TaxID=1884793 RepID=UPI000F8EA589|nr:RNA 2'-phosphotransferase [Pseudoflavitalea rhizosphaerae]